MSDSKNNTKTLDKFLENSASAFRQKWHNITDQKNETLQDFEKIRTVGTGTFGRVILVRHLCTGQHLAMKVLSKKKVHTMNQVSHTLSEKRILLAIEHPFVVKLKYSFKDNLNVYMVLEFIIGGEMFSHLRSVTKYEESQARFYASQVVLAFEYLHNLKIVYRDLKPENILIDNIGYIKITDFGFAKRIKKRTYTLCGTPEYLAPEILLNKGYSKAIDWWAVGILLYEMTAGYPPFIDSEQLKIYEKIIEGKFRILKHFTEELVSLISGLLEKDLSNRLGNLKEGSNDIKNHKWFQGLNWLKIFDKKVTAPYIPKFSDSSDSSNFAKYDEEEIESGETSLYEEEFADF